MRRLNRATHPHPSPPVLHLPPCPHARRLPPPPTGAYPASLDDQETDRILTTLLELGVNTFVCLQAEFSLYTPEAAWRSGQGLRPYIKDAQRLLVRARETNSHRIKQVGLRLCGGGAAVRWYVVGAGARRARLPGSSACCTGGLQVAFSVGDPCRLQPRHIQRRVSATPASHSIPTPSCFVPCRTSWTSCTCPSSTATSHQTQHSRASRTTAAPACCAASASTSTGARAGGLGVPAGAGLPVRGAGVHQQGPLPACSSPHQAACIPLPTAAQPTSRRIRPRPSALPLLPAAGAGMAAPAP